MHVVLYDMTHDVVHEENLEMEEGSIFTQMLCVHVYNLVIRVNGAVMRQKDCYNEKLSLHLQFCTTLAKEPSNKTSLKLTMC